MMSEYEYGETIYANQLANEADVEGFKLEGDACITFPHGRMRMEQAYERDPEKGLHANFIFWCPEEFPADIAVSWEFLPRSDAGLAMFWLSATGKNGEDLFDPSLSPRDGDYKQYIYSDINALHISYFRRNPSEISFQTCNLRKSYGFHMTCQGADPLPCSRDAVEPYRMEAIKCGPCFQFSINDLKILEWVDSGKTYGQVLGKGKIGFRQMAGLIAEYGNLQVRSVRRKKS